MSVGRPEGKARMHESFMRVGAERTRKREVVNSLHFLDGQPRV
jgi:hypothetical protein